MHKVFVTAVFLASALACGQVRAEELDALKAVSAETLGKANGKEGLSLNIAGLESTHAYNQANGASSGSASIGAGALSDVNGVAAVVVNSGNNAVVQISQQVIFNLH